MDAHATALATSDAINGLGSLFMTDMDTYAKGGELGYAGIDFYIGGRGAVLGEVPAQAVVDAFVYFEPANVTGAWERTAKVADRATTAQQFADVAHTWANAHLPDGPDYARLADLAQRVSDAGAAAYGPEVAPLFHGWRALPEPAGDDVKALALHRMNGLREFRGALHGRAILAAGIDPLHAVLHRTPYMAGIFGWAEPHPDLPEDLAPAWAAAQAATEEAVAVAFEPLTDDERDDFAALAVEVNAAATAG